VHDVADQMDFEGLPLIVTDGFDFYEKSVTDPSRFRAGRALCAGPAVEG